MVDIILKYLPVTIYVNPQKTQMTFLELYKQTKPEKDHTSLHHWP